MKTQRTDLYLAALLEGIPSAFIKKTFDDIKTTDIAKYLQRANQYATANNAANNNTTAQQFVISPFENLKKGSTKNKENKEPLTQNFIFQPRALDLSKDFFPKFLEDKKKSAKNFEFEIKNLWKSFENDFQRFATQTDLKQRAETTLTLLHQYAVTIPNPTAVHPEVSWYDYAKIKAGLAVCLYDYDTQTPKNEKPLLLIRADISGIQEFINSIASKNASKNLKGRSFYVQLLADTVLRLLLKKLALFEGNVMYASGGNFFILAPNTQEVNAAFGEFEQAITKAIFEEHQTRISVVMGGYAISESEILEGKINGAIRQLFENVIDVKKKRKFVGLIKSDYDRFFNPSDEGGAVPTDAITGEEIIKGKDKKIYKIGDKSLPTVANAREIEAGDSFLIKEATAKQIFLGNNLKDATYLIVSATEIQTDLPRHNEYTINPCNLGLHYYIVQDAPEVRSKFENALKNHQGCEVLTLNARTKGKIKINNFGKNNSPSFMLYGGNAVPEIESYHKTAEQEERFKGQPKYFHELSGEGSFKRLAVLKMDVDGLGGIFKDDAARDNLTFSYYAALSRNLDWFFKGYLNTLWENETFGKNKEQLNAYTQIIYSGGDDLFIIGRWDAIVHFAELIKNEFAEFTGFSDTKAQNNEQKITISGGIAIVTDKFPIMKASAFAGDAEHAAKNHKIPNPKHDKNNQEESKEKEHLFKKNSISLLGRCFHWDSEYLLVKALKIKLVKYIDDKYGIPKSLLMKIQMHAQRAELYAKSEKKYQDALKQGKNITPPSPQWVWQALYDFAKMEERVKGENQVFIRELKHALNATEQREMFNFLDNKQQFLTELSQAIFTNRWENMPIRTERITFMELLGFAARWAELEVRTN